MQQRQRNDVLEWANRYEITDLFYIFSDKDIRDPFLKIQILNLSYRSLQVIPDFFANFRELQILDFSHNNITDIPMDVVALPKLQYIDMSHNPVGTIPTFAKGVVVKSLYCQDECI